jgi:DNA (cytosine-5)-methyltransferase 1
MIKQELDASEAGRRIPVSTGARFMKGGEIPSIQMPTELVEWLHDDRLRGYCQHEARSHMRSDLHRYLYAACYASSNDGVSPKVDEFPYGLLPDHGNIHSSEVPFRDRFRVQASNFPSSTVVSHISKDGHYYIHYDPAQCRSLTVREAARLQTFPDNYYFEGNRTEQYWQVGNAVPPFLARQVARVVAEVVLGKGSSGIRRDDSSQEVTDFSLEHAS